MGASSPVRSPLDRALLGVAGGVMFLMMALTFIDVLGRYLVRSPVPGAFEMVQFLLPLLIFTVLPVITKDDSHITVTALDTLLSARVRRIQRVAVQIVSAAVLALVCWALWRQGAALNEGRYVSGYLEWPIGPMAYVMSGLCFLSCLVQIARIRQEWQKR